MTPSGSLCSLIAFTLPDLPLAGSPADSQSLEREVPKARIALLRYLDNGNSPRARVRLIGPIGEICTSQISRCPFSREPEQGRFGADGPRSLVAGGTANPVIKAAFYPLGRVAARELK